MFQSKLGLNRTVPFYRLDDEPRRVENCSFFYVRIIMLFFNFLFIFDYVNYYIIKT